MPDESCRNCGGNLDKCTLCAECREAVTMICTDCGMRTLEKIHGFCMYHIDNIQTNEELNLKQYSSFQRISSLA